MNNLNPGSIVPTPARRDPWAALEAAASSERPWFAWHDGTTGQRLLTGDCDFWTSDAGEARFEDAARALAGRPAAQPSFLAIGFERGATVWTPRQSDHRRVRGDASLPVLAQPEAQPQWERRVLEARDAIRRGTLDKVVLARAEVWRPDETREFDAAATLRTLHRRHPGAICFAAGHGDGVLLGATPEVLVRVEGDRVTTHAVAGTARRGADAAEDDALAQELLDSAKERREHDIVVDAIRRALGPICTRLEIPDAPTALRLARVQHLVTPVRGRLAPDSGALPPLLRIAQRLHPTPAVGGWPRADALQWLRDKEPLDRGLYTGPVGWIAPDGGGVMAVAIRCAWLTPRAVTAWAGAGIVGASDPTAEWSETDLKLGTVRESLQQRDRADDGAGT